MSRGDQLPGEGLLTGGHRAQDSVYDGVGAAFGHRDEAYLRKGTLALVVAAAAELLVVGRSVGHIEDHTVDGHDPQTAQPGSAGTGPGHRHRDPLEEQLQRRFTQPRTGLRQSARGRHRPVIPPVPQKP